jgi:3-phytase
MATLETSPVDVLSESEDSADDPAIWAHPTAGELSIIFGSNKVNGIHAYNLKGEEVQYLKLGKINNIDVRQGIKLGSKDIDILGASNLSDNSINLFFIDPRGRISTITSLQILLEDMTPYGFCLGTWKENQLHIYVNSKTGEIREYTLEEQSGQLYHYWSRTFNVSTQVEGMVVDDMRGMLYVGEEQYGIHQIPLHSPKFNSTIITGSTEKNDQLKYDIEGLTLFYHDQQTYIIASSQGNFSYPIFDVNNDQYIGSFKIVDGIVDGAEETDGIDINQSISTSIFPSGILVVQDGFNMDGIVLKKQNFKIIDLSQIHNLIAEIIERDD